MNKNRKSKLVLFSVIGLAAVSIGTVGFATWVVGVQKKTESLTVTALVDNTKNSSVYLEAVVENSPVKVAETSIYPTAESQPNKWDIVTASTESGAAITVDPNALQFKFTTLQYSYGNDATIPTKLTIELLEGESDNIANKVSLNEVKRTGDRNSSWRYLKFKHEYTLNTSETNLAENKLKVTEVNQDGKSFKKFTVDNKIFTLEWGSYFNEKNPVSYYNSLSENNIYNNGEVIDKVSAMFTLADQAYAEIAQMNKQAEDEVAKENQEETKEMLKKKK